MMTEEKAERIIHDTIKKMDNWGKRPTQVLVHPDYHLLFSGPAHRAGLNLVINMEIDAPLDKIMFR
jgi:hypothetical protein